MNQRQLSYFIEVYKFKSIKKAAEHLMISTQGLSKMIINLERELERDLFDRNGSVLIPTEAADTLLPHAYTILDEYRIIEDKNTYRKRIVIYSIEGIFEYLTSEFLAGFYKKYPHIALEIIVVTNQLAINHMKMDEGDIAFLQYPFELPEFKSIFLFSYTFAMVINKNNPLSQKKRILAKNWDGQMIAGRGQNYALFKNYVNNLNEQGYYPIVRLSSNNEKLLMSLAENNLAVAAMSKHVANSLAGNNVVIIDLDDEKTVDKIYLVYKESKKMTDESKAFIDYLILWIKSHQLNS